MNHAGDPDCLLSLVPYDRNHWLVWLAGEGDRFHILPDSLAHHILSSARSQSGRIQPTLLAQGHGRYLFAQPNTFAACLRPQAETQTGGRLEVAEATAAQLRRRLAGAWRNEAFG
jgi:hypothetical protein